MAITNTDIKLFQAQDNTDNDNGGGSRTANEVVDGAANNLFPDISRIDTVSGDVALRKVFPVIDTDNRDIYYGAHAMLRKIPEDPLVSSLLFFTDDPHDERVEAQNKIEAYLVPSFESTFYLYGNHIEGSRAVTWLQRTEESLPEVGETYLLKYGSNEQYIRLDNIEYQNVTLTYQQSTYTRRRVIATITQPLTYSFPGSSFEPDGQQSNTTDTFNTQIADAAKFYGTRKLELDAKEGQTVIQVDSIYEQLVPSTTKQTPLVNNNALKDGVILVNDPDSDVAEIRGNYAGTAQGQAVNTLTPILPSSFRSPDQRATDDGNGNIINSSGVVVGEISYEEGLFTLTAVSGSGNYYYKPASVYDATVKNSAMISITQENVGSVYVMNLNPMPSIPNLYVDYRTNGKWYRMTCNLDGTIGNDASIGAGNLSNNGDGTGTASVTLGAVPDLESQIIFSWSDQGSAVDYSNVTADANMTYKLNHTNIKADTFVMNVDGHDVTCDDNGVINHNEAVIIRGNVILETGLVNITYLHNPLGSLSGSTVITFDYEYFGEITVGDGAMTVVQDPVFTESVDSEGYTTLTGNIGTLDGQSIIIKMAGYLRARNYNVFDSPESITVRNVRDSSAPGGLGLAGYFSGSSAPHEKVIKGYYDKTGLVVLKIQKYAIKTYASQYKGLLNVNSGFNGVTSISNIVPIYTETDEDSLIDYNINSISFQSEGIPPTAPTTTVNKSITGADFMFQMQLPAYIVGEVNFSIDDVVYESKGDNIYLTSGIQVGTINKINGVCEIQYATVENLDVTVRRCYTDSMIDQHMTKLCVFRTASDDLVTSSLQVRYTTTTGTYNATSDGNGVINGTDLDPAQSYVDTRTGAVMLFFINAADPASIKYDAVAQTTLPLDPELLGLNPVRLPPNGKVPVISAGYHLVIFNEQETDIIGTPVAGDTITLDRDKQAYVEVSDVNGARLAFDQYSVDRDNGVLTFADPLSLVDRNGDPMTAPYMITDRVEDMVLCTSADITGAVGISAPLTRDYPANETRIASALVWGDVGARYYKLFSQQTFNEWKDEPDTDPITAQYDDVNYPIQINNKDSVAGRWLIRFLSSTSVEVIEENLGVVIAGLNITSTNVAPLNPATNQPYWVMDFNGFGSGWVVGNVIRFNTASGEENMWIIRTVKSGQLTLEVDAMDIEIRGDAN